MCGYQTDPGQSRTCAVVRGPVAMEGRSATTVPPAPISGFHLFEFIFTCRPCFSTFTTLNTHKSFADRILIAALLLHVVFHCNQTWVFLPLAFSQPLARSGNGLFSDVQHLATLVRSPRETPPEPPSTLFRLVKRIRVAQRGPFPDASINSR